MSDSHEVLEASVLQTLHSLKVIATIKENDRISTKKGIYVDTTENYIQSILRWINSENRSHNVGTLENVFNRAFDICWNLLDSKKALLSKPEKLLECDQRIQRLDTEIRNAQRGVSNLLVTYETDTHTVAKLQVINETVHDRLQLLECALKNNREV